jgi:oligopeptide transport system permease protein
MLERVLQLVATGTRPFRGDRTTAVAFGLLLSALLFAMVFPAFSPFAPDATDAEVFSPPSPRHPLGSDLHGRDLLVRIAVATRISILVGAAGAAVSLGIGVGWGLVAGYFGGKVDAWMMRIVDLLYALPSVVLVLLVLNFFESAVASRLQRVFPDSPDQARLILLVLCLGGISWLTMARIVRGQVLSLKERPFILASRALGAGAGRILFLHLLPNLSGIILVYLTLTVPAVMLQESFLSVLGLGIRPPQASLGTLIADGASQLNPVRMRLWLLVFPAGALAGILWALGRVGDALREAFEPRDRDV